MDAHVALVTRAPNKKAFRSAADPKAQNARRR
jgi:hypothetical protein